MKAILVSRFGDADVLELGSVEDPVPGNDELVIDIKAIGVNPADTYMRTGTYAVVPDLPYIPGGDAAGIVSAVGTGVTQFKTGDRVYTGMSLGLNMTGCYAEKVVRPVSDVVRLPPQVDFAAGAALGVPYATAHYALFGRGKATADDCVLIHGASGAVGTAAIQLARRAGMKVIGSGGSERGRSLILREGADHVVDHTSQGYTDEIKRFTNGAGPTIILEMLANVNLATDLEIAARYGRIIVIGNRGEIKINPRLAMGKELDIRGIALVNASRRLLEDIQLDLLEGLSDGSLKPVIGQQLPLSQASEAHQQVLEPGAYGKIILEP